MKHGGVLGLGPLLTQFTARLITRHQILPLHGRLGELQRYGEFVDLTVERVDAGAAHVSSLAKVFHDSSPSGDHAIQRQLEEVWRASRVAQLDIEAFYLFAKILLDRWSCFIEPSSARDVACPFSRTTS